MSGKTTQSEQFTKWPRGLSRSDAWRSLGINARRFIDFLIEEHMDHGGKQNGKLKAPHHQLEVFGIGARHIAAAIREAEGVGLVDCNRGGMRVATTYGLTFLPLHDGRPASHRWRQYVNPDLKPLPSPKPKNLPSQGKAGSARKTKNLPSEGKVALPSEGKADDPNLPSEGEADWPKNLPSEGRVLSRDSYQGGADSTYLSVERRRAAGGAP